MLFGNTPEVVLFDLSCSVELDRLFRFAFHGSGPSGPSSSQTIAKIQHVCGGNHGFEFRPN